MTGFAPIMRGFSLDPTADAIIEQSGTCSYGDLAARADQWQERLTGQGIAPQDVVSLEADYSADSVSVLIALARIGVILVPLSTDSRTHRDEFLEVAQVQWRVDPAAPVAERTGRAASHDLYQELRKRQTAGLVLFTSGSTGRNKAAVHDLYRLCEKFAVPKRCFRTLVFLQPDHIGGINTLLYTLSNGGAAILPANRSPAHVCDLIERHRVELLPTSPTFLNLLLLARDPSAAPLESLQLITYGTEPMPATTLARVQAAFPNVRLQQTYGLTEIGILRSQSRPDGSLWVKVGGEGYDVKVIDGRLWVKAASAMLGYLNAPSPFGADGYLDTGDAVEVDGEWLRILGRQSEMINVGGSKVFPAEVEDVLMQMPNVDDVVVTGEPHPIMGHIVAARLKLIEPEPLDALKLRVRQFCSSRLAAFKIPARVVIAEVPLHGARFKKQRLKPSDV